MDLESTMTRLKCHGQLAEGVSTFCASDKISSTCGAHLITNACHSALPPAEGVLMYSLDDALVFDPTDLGQEVTPAAVHAAVARGAWLRAFLLALRLNQPDLLRHVILSTPPQQVRHQHITTNSTSPKTRSIRHPFFPGDAERECVQTHEQVLLPCACPHLCTHA